MNISTLNFTTTTFQSVISTVSKLTATQKEHHLSLTFFFILSLVGICILIIHLLINMKIHYLPESVAIVFVGGLIGLILKMMGNWRQEEEFPPMVFFLVFLPPIIFESGYNLHKGNFFQNIGSILVFAILGTIISTIVIGGGLYLCGIANLAYRLSIFESFGFGSLISAVDPVATLAIFKAMDVDPILYMLVFGESILNDAVSIVLMTTIMNLDKPEFQNEAALKLIGQAIGGFLGTFLASAALGIAFGLISALILKWIDLRKTPSLEVGIMLVFCFAPYCLAEGIKLSGIMAILFDGIVMSHYTHRNLSPITQMTVQQIFRTLAFMAETIVFAYLGLAIFSFKHRAEPALIGWILVLCLVGRAVNIFPLSYLLNFFRDIKITKKNQVVMWFSGLRGAIAFALVLHLEGISQETSQVLITTTLIVVLCSIIFLGGLTLPFMKFINWFTACSSSNIDSDSEDDLYVPSAKLKSRNRRPFSSPSKLLSSSSLKNNSLNGSTTFLIKEPSLLKRTRKPSTNPATHEVFISKTKEMGDALDSENNMSGYYDTEAEFVDNQNRHRSVRKRVDIQMKPATDNKPENRATTPPSSDVTAMGKVAPSLRGFMRLDAKYFFPFFTRCHTEKEVMEARKSMNSLTDQWSKAVRTDKPDTEDYESPVSLSALKKSDSSNKLKSDE
uniref:Sodium/hydrogen exchanger n=1 Tax=Schmidtea mediterranea TaxID=79327 RepID=A0A0H3YK40_SCHMD|nr:slc9a-5 [Schmidtea mediterranea]